MPRAKQTEPKRREPCGWDVIQAYRETATRYGTAYPENAAEWNTWADKLERERLAWEAQQREGGL